MLLLRGKHCTLSPPEEHVRLNPESLRKLEVKTQVWHSLPWAEEHGSVFPLALPACAGRGRALAPDKLGLRPNSRALGADWQPFCLSNLGDPEKRMNIRIPEQNQQQWCSCRLGLARRLHSGEDEVMVTNERRGRPLECRAERGSQSKASSGGSISRPAMAL